MEKHDKSRLIEGVGAFKLGGDRAVIPAYVRRQDDGFYINPAF